MDVSLPKPKRRRRSLPDRVARWIAASIALLVYRLVQRLDMKGVRRLAKVLWYLAWPLSASVKRKSRQNLAACLPDKTAAEREAILRQATYNLLYGGLLTWRLETLTPDELRSLVDVRGREHLDAALAKGKGVIAIGAHVGPFSLIGARLALDGYDYGVAIRISSDERLERIMARLRKKLGVKGFYRSFQTLRMVKHLRGGGILHLFLDQHVAANGVVIEFCGIPAPTFAGPATLARRLGCPVLPIFLVPKRQDGEPEWVIEIGPEYVLEWTDDEDADILRATQMFSDTIEEYVRRYPEYWIWMHGRLIRSSDKPRLAWPHLLDRLPARVREYLLQHAPQESPAAASD